MGYYLNARLGKFNKVRDIKHFYGAQEISLKDIPLWNQIPEDKIMIAVVENGVFDAALVCVDRNEHNFIKETIHKDDRPITLLLMDRKSAYENCGYKT
jgi:hypothetical protein